VIPTFVDDTDHTEPVISRQIRKRSIPKSLIAGLAVIVVLMGLFVLIPDLGPKLVGILFVLIPDLGPKLVGILAQSPAQTASATSEGSEILDPGATPTQIFAIITASSTPILAGTNTPSVIVSEVTATPFSLPTATSTGGGLGQLILMEQAYKNLQISKRGLASRPGHGRVIGLSSLHLAAPTRSNTRVRACG